MPKVLTVKNGGLYVTENKAFNADTVGAFNILRKYLYQRRKGPDIDLKVGRFK
ncbi:MAG: hypothetical protein U5K53_08775 [Halanaerobiales bacterium]|nr:hypothetical protein [Halanaerobiales bacterium]